MHSSRVLGSRSRTCGGVSAVCREREGMVQQRVQVGRSGDSAEPLPGGAGERVTPGELVPDAHVSERVGERRLAHELEFIGEKKKARLAGLFSCDGCAYLRNTEAFNGRPLDNAEWKYSRLFMTVPPCAGGTARTCLKQPS